MQDYLNIFANMDKDNLKKENKEIAQNAKKKRLKSNLQENLKRRKQVKKSDEK